MPIYVAYDSSDVWANPKFFSVDDKGKSDFKTQPDSFGDLLNLRKM